MGSSLFSERSLHQLTLTHTHQLEPHHNYTTGNIELSWVTSWMPSIAALFARSRARARGKLSLHVNRRDNRLRGTPRARRATTDRDPGSRIPGLSPRVPSETSKSLLLPRR